MTRPNQSTQLRNPNPDKDEEGRKIYIALLERRCLMLGFENLRLRACMERATGEPWDSSNLADPTPEDLDEMVAQDISRGLRMTVERARDLVAHNKRLANPTQFEVPVQSNG